MVEKLFLCFRKNNIFLGCVIYSGNVALDKSVQNQRGILHFYLKVEVSLRYIQEETIVLGNSWSFLSQLIFFRYF